ncbi:anti-sigma factor family protein, partial [Paenibacillus zanthoxyli]|uniref:anti-sigma factor family protein n=1 Tax=Paenibacillus zanthoxyli TaxID=369399 RepID=UPI00056C861A
MNCAEVMEWMHRYLDHDLSRDESLEMFRHIDGCPSCAELFERLNALSSELEQLPDISPPFSLVDSIMPKLEAIDRERAA